VPHLLLYLNPTEENLFWKVKFILNGCIISFALHFLLLRNFALLFNVFAAGNIARLAYLNAISFPDDTILCLVQWLPVPFKGRNDAPWEKSKQKPSA